MNYIKHTDWYRKGFSYRFEINYTNCTYVASYNLITYYIIKWIHGQEVLRKMILDKVKSLSIDIEKEYKHEESV